MANGPDSGESDVVASRRDDAYATRRSITAAVLLVLVILVVLLLFRGSGEQTTVTRSRDTSATGGGLAIAYPPPVDVETTGVIVPGVVGSVESEARAKLRGAQLSVSIHWISAGEPYGTVVHQSPSAGVEVPPLTLVELTLSTGLAGGGSGSVAVAPSVVGLTDAGARARLRDVGWTVTVVYGASTTADRGTVFYQSPGAGEPSEGTTHMLVWVSNGGSPRWPSRRPQ